MKKTLLALLMLASVAGVAGYSQQIANNGLYSNIYGKQPNMTPINTTSLILGGNRGGGANSVYLQPTQQLRQQQPAQQYPQYQAAQYPQYQQAYTQQYAQYPPQYQQATPNNGYYIESRVPNTAYVQRNSGFQNSQYRQSPVIALPNGGNENRQPRYIDGTQKEVPEDMDPALASVLEEGSKLQKNQKEAASTIQGANIFSRVFRIPQQTK